MPGFEHAATPSLGAHFTDVGFPAGAVAFITTPPEANGFQYHLAHICVTGTTADAVRGFYATDAVSHAWATTATLPTTGDLSTACTNTPYCWIKNDGVIRFLGLEDVATAGSLTTFSLRLVIQPLSFGGSLLNAGEALDFDPVSLGGGTDDVSWNGSALTSVGGAALHNVGIGLLAGIGYSDCAGYSYAASSLSASTLVVGDVFAVQTGDHHVVKVRVENHLGTQLTLQWIAYPYTF